MSAINILIQTSAVHVLTDGIGYGAQGEILTIGPKVSVLPHLSAIFAMRGPHVARPPLAELVGVCATSFDGLRGILVEVLQQASIMYAPVFQQCAGGPDFEVVIAGISETDGPCAYLVASHERYGKPWRVMPMEGLTLLPNSEAINAAVPGIVPAGSVADEVDPEVHGLQLLELQRATLIGAGGQIEGETCLVGGFAQLTSVDRAGIRTRIIRRWPDEVGRRLVN